VRRAAVVGAGVLTAAIVAAGVALFLDARDTDGHVPSSPRASVSVVSATVRPAVHHFGDPVVAELVVVADKALVDPASVRVDPDFTPYEPVGPRVVQRTETATGVRWRIRFPLRCLGDDCAPDGDRRTFDFPTTGVVYRFRSSAGRSTALVEWPSFQVSARVPSDALAPQSWRAEVTALPGVTSRAQAGTLAAGLLLGSIVLALLGFWIVWRLTRREAPDVVEEPEVEEELTSLERALRLAHEASADGDSPERRKALERVARELGARGLPDLADRARSLAWAPGAASAVAVEELVRESRAATNGSHP
jgi:hypothetical protein